MHFSDKFKKIWWIISIVVVLLLLCFRLDEIITGNATSFDIGLLIILAALASIPLFSEFTYLGLSVKQSIEETKQSVDETKKELKHDIRELNLSLRSEIQNAININNTSHQYLFNNVDSEQALSALQSKIESEKREHTQIMEADIDPLDYFQVEDNIQIAFKSRMIIEIELRRIWGIYTNQDPPRHSASWFLDQLSSKGIVSESLRQLIRNVFAITSPIIHGEPATQENIDVLVKVVPKLIKELEEIDVIPF